jgi:septation ring formation regulator EzrA
MPEIDAKLKHIEDSLNKIIARLKQLKEKSKVVEEDLSPLQEKLHEIDNIYIDGRFVIEGDIPAGQATISELLNTAHELVQLLLDASESE